MSMEQIDEDKVYRIVTKEIAIERRDINIKLEEIRAVSSSNKELLNGQDVVLAKMSVKMDAMYGNGSGKVGILDEIRNEQKDVADKFNESEKIQSKFRHEVRGILERIALQEATEKTVTTQIETRYGNKKEKNLAWIKWVVGGAAYVVAEYVKIHFFKVS